MMSYMFAVNQGSPSGTSLFVFSMAELKTCGEAAFSFNAASCRNNEEQFQDLRAAGCVKFLKYILKMCLCGLVLLISFAYFNVFMLFYCVLFFNCYYHYFYIYSLLYSFFYPSQGICFVLLH